MLKNLKENLKNRWKKIKISKKLTIIYSSMIYHILLFFAICVVASFYFYIDRQNKVLIKDVADNVEKSIHTISDINDGSWETLAFQKNIFIVFYSQDGEEIKKSEGIEHDYTSKLDSTKLDKPIVDLYTENYESVYLNRKLTIEGTTVIIQTIKSLNSEFTFLEIAAVIMTIFMVLGIGISVILGHYLNRRLLKPISTMTDNANHIQQNGVLGDRLELTGNDDEINQLGRTINTMLDRMELSVNRQSQFISDASHELRTPLTVILSYAEILKKWAKDDVTARDKAIDKIEQEALDMTQLIERLLVLAKNESKALRIHNEPVDVHALINEVVEETRLIADQREIIIQVKDKININTDRERLKELLRIILDNSIKYTADNGRIAVTLAGGEHRLIITVHDNGIGIKAEDLDKIFDRFYCAETSRNKKKSGNGLGLSIAKVLAKELGFEIKAESQEGAWTKIILIQYPAASYGA